MSIRPVCPTCNSLSSLAVLSYSCCFLNCLLSLCFFISSEFTNLGLICCSFCGTNVLIFLENNLSLGLAKSLFGDALHSMGSFAVFRIFFTVFTAFPLLLGVYGKDVVCSKHHYLENFLNSVHVYCGPLSLCTSMGLPCLANIFLMPV